VNLIDNVVAYSLLPLGVWFLVSGLDDFFLDLVAAWDWLRRKLPGSRHAAPPDEVRLSAMPAKRVAIFVPLWHEHRVIGAMLEHNLASIRYPNYDFFIGAYPNDEFTIEAVREAEQRFSNVHLALCPHDGPTSKADCLNWIYQRMLVHEETTGAHYELVVLHDAEDLVHPEELRWINYYSDTYGMVQIPVLPLPTPVWEFTHGVYCDEFAEYQSKDIPARQILGGFIPSNGVGTGYARWALELLAQTSGNRIFDPEALTEDYETGLRLHELGCPQIFVPIQMQAGVPVATREYFPQSFRPALKQRTRWVMGNSLQSWERHGWKAGLRQLYWYWRDRKGVVGNPVTALANLAMIYGAATWFWSQHTGSAWGLAATARHPAAVWLLWMTVWFQFLRIGVRTGCVTRIYGWQLALAVPFRIVWANWINFLATVSAVGRYGMARIQHRPLVWIKTEHTYPSRVALDTDLRRIGEVLVGSAYIEEPDLRDALASKPAGVRLGEYLVQLGRLSEDDLYEALSLQHGIPFQKLDPEQVPIWVARGLPASEARRWKILPFKVSAGRLFVAGAELPTEDMRRALRKHTALDLQFQLITPTNLHRLADLMLGQAVS
jgi:adsorption protein B